MFSSQGQIKRLSVKDYPQLTSNRGYITSTDRLQLSAVIPRSKNVGRQQKVMKVSKHATPFLCNFSGSISAENAKPLLTKKIQWGTGEAVIK